MLLAFNPQRIPQPWQENYQKITMRVIVENTVARPGEYFTFSANGQQVVFGDAEAPKYNVTFKDGKFSVSSCGGKPDSCTELGKPRAVNSHKWVRRRYDWVVRFHAVNSLPGKFEERLQDCLSQYKIDILTNGIMMSGTCIHHIDVMSIGELVEHITTERPLVIFDVDDTLVTTHTSQLEGNQTQVDPVEEKALFQNVIDHIKAKAPEARFLLLTNAHSTKLKFSRAGIKLDKGIDILEFMSPEEFKRQKREEPDYGTYVARASHKGNRLGEFLDEQGVNFDCVHFIDDLPDNLILIAEEMSKRSFPCHIYDFILTAERVNKIEALRLKGSTYSDELMEQFYFQNPDKLKRLAISKILRT